MVKKKIKVNTIHCEGSFFFFLKKSFFCFFQKETLRRRKLCQENLLRPADIRRGPASWTNPVGGLVFQMKDENYFKYFKSSGCRCCSVTFCVTYYPLQLAQYATFLMLLGLLLLFLFSSSPTFPALLQNVAVSQLWYKVYSLTDRCALSSHLRSSYILRPGATVEGRADYF